MELELLDPTYIPSDSPSLFESWAEKLILDKRDLPFIRLILMILVSVVPFAVYLYVTSDFPWWLGAAYLILTLGYFMGPVILMLHNTSHRVLFKSKALKNFIPWVIGPFFGETPETYFTHHIGMHHAENNLPPDLSSTMRYQRDSVVGFSHYLGSFYLFGFSSIVLYMYRKGRKKLFRRAIAGEFSYFLVAFALAFVNFKATMYVFFLPLLIVRFGMMAGNWAQHAFIDQKDPGNNYLNSITCINSTYNKRCFNDGYHIGHHIKPGRHWTEMPEDFLRNKHLYAAQNAIVFKQLDYFVIWLFLMAKQYDRLASHVVQLNPSAPKSREEIIALLKERTRPFSRAS